MAASSAACWKLVKCRVTPGRLALEKVNGWAPNQAVITVAAAPLKPEWPDM